MHKWALILQANSWSPAPGVLQPAQPGQAAQAPSVAGPLAMSVQQSWSAPARPLPPASTIVRPPVARPVDLDYSYRASAPMSSAAPGGPSTGPVDTGYSYRSSMPLSSAAAGRNAELFAPGGPSTNPVDLGYNYRASAPFSNSFAGRNGEGVMPGVDAASRGVYNMPLAQSMSLGNRALQQQMSMPAMGAAEASRAMYQQPGPLSGGLMQQTAPASPQLYQQASMPGTPLALCVRCTYQQRLRLLHQLLCMSSTFAPRPLTKFARRR